jgi:hypothetical protein
VHLAQDFPLRRPKRITLPEGWAQDAPPSLPQQLESALAKPPNFKQEKKRREEAQKKRNEEKQREIAARRENVPRPPQKP